MESLEAQMKQYSAKVEETARQLGMVQTQMLEMHRDQKKILDSVIAEQESIKKQQDESIQSIISSQKNLVEILKNSLSQSNQISPHCPSSSQITLSISLGSVLGPIPPYQH